MRDGPLGTGPLKWPGIQASGDGGELLKEPQLGPSMTVSDVK